MDESFLITKTPFELVRAHIGDQPVDPSIGVMRPQSGFSLKTASGISRAIGVGRHDIFDATAAQYAAARPAWRAARFKANRAAQVRL
jgi:hypothetical protein